MHIHSIERLDEFVSLRANWDAIYEADPDAHAFLSWQWLADWFNVYSTASFILAAKRDESDSEYVALLPMRIKTAFDKTRGFSNEILLAGAGFADYAGILSRPEFEAEAVPAFADYVKRKLNWEKFTLDNLMMSERRRRLFLREFHKTRFTETPLFYRNPNDPSNHGVCPSAKLPASWDQYLASLSSNNRQKIRRFLKKVDAAEDCRITLSDADSFDQNLRVLLDFWKNRWTPSKGEAAANNVVSTTHKMMMHCAEHGRLLLPVFWQGDRPVAAHATIIDPVKKSLLFFITGRDETYDAMPAGYLLHAYSIRHAIENGFTLYDFLKGDEPYKYQFARNTRYIRAVSIAPKMKGNLGGRPDPKGLQGMIEMTLEFETRGEVADAELGYRQILDLAPDHALALYRFGRLKATNRAHVEAKELLSRSVMLDPDGDNAWFLLGRSLQALGEDGAALEAYRTVVKLQPQNEEAKKLVLELALAAKPEAKSAKTRPSASSSSPSPPIDLATIDPTAEKVRQVIEASKRVKIIGG